MVNDNDDDKNILMTGGLEYNFASVYSIVLKFIHKCSYIHIYMFI